MRGEKGPNGFGGWRDSDRKKEFHHLSIFLFRQRNR